MPDRRTTITRLPDRAVTVIQWSAAVLAALVCTVFLLSQTQTASVAYGERPSASAASNSDGPPPSGTDSVPGRGTGSLPDSATIERALAGPDRVIRLPGAVAWFDERAVFAALDRLEADRRALDPQDDVAIKVVLTPPGLTSADSERLYDLAAEHVRVEGLSVTYRFTATPSDVAGWESLFTIGDTTSAILTLLALAADEPTPPDSPSTVQWRTPTTAELATVSEPISRAGWYAAPGASLNGLPAAVKDAFPDKDTVVVAFGQQRYGEPVPDYATALAAQRPNTVVIAMYGNWIRLVGPFDADTIELAAAGFYGPNDQVLVDRVFPQRNILQLYLNRWVDMRFAGVFERPLPYVPADPLSISKPALPWIFLGSVLALSALSVLTVRRRPTEPATVGTSGDLQPTAQHNTLARLSTLAIEVAPLATSSSQSAALTRGIKRLDAARDGLAEGLPAPAVNLQLRAARREFAVLAESLQRNDYHPDAYLKSTVADNAGSA